MAEPKFPPRIMYIERKDDKDAPSLNGPARIGRVTFSRTGSTVHYDGKSFHKISGYKANFREEGTGNLYWISGPKRNGEDRLYASNIPIEIDEDIREEYWIYIRERPELRHSKSTFGAEKPRK